MTASVLAIAVLVVLGCGTLVLYSWPALFGWAPHMPDLAAVAVSDIVSAGPSSAGGWPTPSRPTWPSTRWRWLSGLAKKKSSPAWSITPIAGQYLSIRYSERLAEVGAAGSVGSKGDSYDNALAESVFGLYKAELITLQGPWRTIEDVELATLTWVHWWNTSRLHSAIGDIPPSEYEAAHYAQQSLADKAGQP